MIEGWNIFAQYCTSRLPGTILNIGTFGHQKFHKLCDEGLDYCDPTIFSAMNSSFVANGFHLSVTVTRCHLLLKDRFAKNGGKKTFLFLFFSELKVLFLNAVFRAEPHTGYC